MQQYLHGFYHRFWHIYQIPTHALTPITATQHFHHSFCLVLPTEDKLQHCTFHLKCKPPERAPVPLIYICASCRGKEKRNMTHNMNEIIGVLQVLVALTLQGCSLLVDSSKFGATVRSIEVNSSALRSASALTITKYPNII